MGCSNKRHLLLARMGSERTFKSSFKRDHSSWGWKKQWSSSPREVENDAGIYSYLDVHRPSSFTSSAEDTKAAAENANNHPFINQAAIAWTNMRQEWVGDCSKICRMRHEPAINRFSTYNDLLSTTRPFPKSIPLSEMVDFLVDIWHEEGLYD